MAQHKITDDAARKAIWAAIGQDTETLPAVITVTVAKTEEVRFCSCGCGGETARLWVPGHDAKHKSRLFALARGTDATQAKLAKAELTKRQWPLPSTKAGTSPAPLPVPEAK